MVETSTSVPRRRSARLPQCRHEPARTRVPDRRGRCGCGRVQRELTGWAASGHGSGNRSHWCFQNEGRRWAAEGRRAEGRPWLGRWAWGWTGPLRGCPCSPRSLSSKSLPLHRCSPSHCSGCRTGENTQRLSHCHQIMLVTTTVQFNNR